MGTFIEEVAAVDFRDPLTILMEREGDSADDVHSGWTSGRARTRISEFDAPIRFEAEPEYDRTVCSKTWNQRQSW
jgi:hypothetical protein